MAEPGRGLIPAPLGIRWSQLAGASVPLLLISAIAYPAYPGSLESYLLFDLLFIVMLLLALPAPRSHAYGFFALMLFLGFWAKLMLHMIFGANFLEPIGNFSGGAAEWGRALLVASMAACGISLARLLQLGLAARFDASARSSAPAVPSWYGQSRKAIWILSLFAILGLNLLNFQTAFYQTGVNPRLVLPFHLNVPLGWLINIGLALWCAVLVHWEFLRSPRSLANTLSLPILESLTSSTSALSRSFYVMHSGSYFFALGSRWAAVRAALTGSRLMGLLLLWILCLAISLTLVSWLRIHVYYLAYEPELLAITPQEKVIPEPVLNAGGSPQVSQGGAPAPSHATPGASVSNQITPMLRQVASLFVDRWIGLEGVLAVSSYSGLSYELLVAAIQESPKKGADSLYQLVAKSNYKATQRFTFLTLPGVVAVLYYSGSLWIVAVGAMLVTALLIGTEFAALRYTANPFLASMAALGLANVVCQVNFPYLAAVFVAQLWVAIAFVWLISSPWRFLHFRRGGKSHVQR